MTKRILWTLGLTLGLLVLARHPAGATPCVIPYVFTNGTVADATQVNANFSSLQSCGNNIDYRNIGAAGIYASQIIPTTSGQATFGGSVGYVFYPNAPAQVPVTINGTPAQSADLLDVTLTTGGTKAFAIGSGGALNLIPSGSGSDSLAVTASSGHIYLNQTNVANGNCVGGIDMHENGSADNDVIITRSAGGSTCGAAPGPAQLLLQSADANYLWNFMAQAATSVQGHASEQLLGIRCTGPIPNCGGGGEQLIEGIYYEGDVAALRDMYANRIITGNTANPTWASTCTAQGCFSSSATAGSIQLGGPTTYKTLDCGVTIVGACNLGAQFNVSSLTANGANFGQTGDIGAARSSTAGVYYFTTAAGTYLDYGVTTAGNFTLAGGGLAIPTGSTKSLTLGTLATYNYNHILMGAGAGSGFTAIGSTNTSTINGVTGNALWISPNNANTNGLASLNVSGDWSVAGQLKAVGNVSGAAITGTGLGSFAGVAAGGAITGATTINASGTITGGGYTGGPISGTTVTGTGLGTFAGVNAGGAITGATTINASSTITGGAGVFGNGFVGATGDGSFGRTASTAEVFLGGSTERSAFDFNISNANATTLSCAGTGCTGNLYATAFFNTSQRAMKKDIKPFTGDPCALLPTEAYTYRFKQGDDQLRYGTMVDRSPKLVTDGHGKALDLEALAVADAMCIRSLEQQNGALTERLTKIEQVANAKTRGEAQVATFDAERSKHGWLWQLFHAL